VGQKKGSCTIAVACHAQISSDQQLLYVKSIHRCLVLYRYIGFVFSNREKEDRHKWFQIALIIKSNLRY
jgi:hypothetical protein